MIDTPEHIKYFSHQGFGVRLALGSEGKPVHLGMVDELWENEPTFLPGFDILPDARV